MGGCLFCRIASGTERAEVVHEAPGAVAFLDAHPAARGHVLVVPRAHAPTLLELDEEGVRELFRAVQLVQRKVLAALSPRGFNVGWNHGRAAGQAVAHLHVHVIPRYDLVGRGIQALGEGGDRGQLAELGAAIRGASPR